MEPAERIRSRLVDSQKRLARIRDQTQGIIGAADDLEETAARDVRRLRHELNVATGPDREIAEAEYLNALDRRRRAGQAGTLARRTLAKVT